MESRINNKDRSVASVPQAPPEVKLPSLGFLLHSEQNSALPTPATGIVASSVMMHTTGRAPPVAAAPVPSPQFFHNPTTVEHPLASSDATSSGAVPPLGRPRKNTKCTCARSVGQRKRAELNLQSEALNAVLERFGALYTASWFQDNRANAARSTVHRILSRLESIWFIGDYLSKRDGPAKNQGKEIVRFVIDLRRAIIIRTTTCKYASAATPVPLNLGQGLVSSAGASSASKSKHNRSRWSDSDASTAPECNVPRRDSGLAPGASSARSSKRTRSRWSDADASTAPNPKAPRNNN